MSLLYTLCLITGVASVGVGFPPIPIDLTTPVQQRIAINGINSVSLASVSIEKNTNRLIIGITIGWNTYEQLKIPCVQYGLTSDLLFMEACSTSSITYPTSRTWSNAVTLNYLLPATTYYYKIVSTNSTVNQFLSPRLAGDRSPFTMNAIIDLGVYGANGYTIGMDESKRSIIPQIQPSLNHTTIGRLANTINDYEIIIHPGDLAYADDWIYVAGDDDDIADGGMAYQSILEQFYGQLAPISSRKPYMTSPGNHEADCVEKASLVPSCPAGQKNFTDFMNRFARLVPNAYTSTSPNIVAQINANKAKVLAEPPFWYSFEYGMVHVTMFDTETDFIDAPDGPGTALNSGPFGAINQQVEFLEADLASVDREVTPWVVVAGHRPWYTTGDDPCDACQAAFEQIFYKYGVDIAVFGHVHNSQRCLPVYNNTVDPAGMNNPTAPMYIVSGGAGNIEGLASLGTNISCTVFGYDEDFSYAALTFMNSTVLQIDFIQSLTGEVLDSSQLYKAHAEQFVVQ